MYLVRMPNLGHCTNFNKIQSFQPLSLLSINKKHEMFPNQKTAFAAEYRLICACWFEWESITTGNMSFFKPVGLSQWNTCGTYTNGRPSCRWRSTCASFPSIRSGSTSCLAPCHTMAPSSQTQMAWVLWGGLSLLTLLK